MRRKTIRLESLESRQLLSAVYPTANEQYMIELYNWARANPAAAATKYGVALNEGLAAGTITTDPKQPLAINPYLNNASHLFAQYMIDHSQFGHTVDGSDPQSRMSAAGYVFSGSWGSGENIGVAYASYQLDPINAMDSEFSNYYTDSGIDGRGHRTNMFGTDWKEAGSGYAAGPFMGMNGIMTVEDFAHSGSSTFLTGVAYNDTSHDNFYTPGEQLAGITITAIRSSDNATFTTNTWTSGGYSLALPAGTYTVWAGNQSAGGWVKYQNVIIGSQNVKRDFRPDYINSSSGPTTAPQEPSAFATLAGGRLTVNGTAGNDTITLSIASGTLSATLNSTTLTFTASSVTSLVINANAGNDRVTIGAGVASSVINGGDGNDVLQGGDNNDVIHGNNGDDKLMGGNRNDKLYGDAGNDSIWGQDGNDFLDGGLGADFISGGTSIDTVDYSTRTVAVSVVLNGRSNKPTGASGQAGELDNVLSDVENINGGSGNDKLVGSDVTNIIHGNAGNDSIWGMTGADVLYGDAGNDTLIDVDSTRDSLNGGIGTDKSTGDVSDLLIAIETH